MWSARGVAEARRQAVLLIHGIGEQRPMDTLRGFVDTVWRRDTDIQNRYAAANADAVVWSKPDTVSESFELRRLTTSSNTAGILTDFFEFYWQHLMQGTTFGHVIAWAWTLLSRKPSNVPRQLRPAYWLLWLLVAVSAMLAFFALTASAPASSRLMSAIASGLVVPLAGLVVKNVIGDAARYLHVAPSNVQCRHAIREAGLSVLASLHARGYDRIIIVGHSLGSVIGYDILTHAWPLHNDSAQASNTDAMAALDRLEQLAATGNGLAADIQDAQRRFFNELVKVGCTWRVTDFLTLGSPLAHADVLLAGDPATLALRQRDREFPTCLPTLESVTREKIQHQRFSFEKDKSRHAPRIPHHAAVFGPTRWTNLYFPCRFIVRGDVVGGPCRRVLGIGINDVAVSTSLRRGFFSHTLYWTMSGDGGDHVRALRNALDLVDARSMEP